MNALIAATLLVIIGVASPGPVGVSPEGLYEAGLLAKAPPPCRELNAAERLERGIDPKGKAATYSLDGGYVCERQIFAYGERNSFADFVLAEASRRAPEVARRVAAMTSAELKGKVWLVTADAPTAELASRLAAVFRHALAKTLPYGQVARHPSGTGAELNVTVRSVQDHDILFDVKVRDAKQTVWRL